MDHRKICVVTGTRAEYGLLRWLIDGISKSPALQLQLIATGMHLSPEFGFTVQEIEADGYHIDRKVEMLLSSDTSVGIAKSMGLGLIGFADALSELQPDMVLVLGDRFEAFAAASASLISRIPIGHIHGGELTEGAFDDAIRHSITKMSYFHFVSADEYRQRVIQMGEDPERVFLVGSLGVDAIRRLKLLTREELEQSLDFILGPRNLLITFHPVTLEHATSAPQMNEILAALDQLIDTHLIFTLPNADTGGRIIINMIRDFCSTRPHAKAFASLGQLRYFSCLHHVDGVVGNSSSGIIEVPSFKKGTVNIGDRQKGRLQGPSILNCQPQRSDILASISQLYELLPRLASEPVVFTSSQQGVAASIVSILENHDHGLGLKKKFYDL